MSNNKRETWDLGRFFATINYFDLIPFFSDLQKLFNPGDRTSPNLENNTMSLILIVGATEKVGQTVVRRLLGNNYRVRALVRDQETAKISLAPGVDLIQGDINCPETLTPKLLENVSAVIYCGKNTDNFPEDGGMKNLLPVVKKYLRSGEKLLFDFTNPNEDLKNTWGAIDDVVMGGVSESNIRLEQNRAVFFGNVSTANNGGFASVRTRNLQPPLDLSNYEGIELQVEGDGKRYKFITRCEGKWDGVGYCYSFDTFYNCPTIVRIPFKDLIPVFRAKTVPEMGKFDSSCVYSMQLMQSKFEYDGGLNPRFSPGLFRLDLKTIKAYGAKANTPDFILIGSIGEELVRNSGLNYSIIAPRGSLEAIADFCLQVLKSPAACQKTFGDLGQVSNLS
ncbi:CIA30 family protein [Crocosphaera sp. UHCC 0190]|uniref:CIA30 family protein n=1 Tax=Crocosphaera sp. UHCC 0190 TaxID=3110246 RepID=UPI002B1ED749|nr:CIA30 family protein [Crocosphaera sp. UHCC 0190]MEA5509084.1 CIA30 family protein [Crocosphaera sp. UHCC 0190]